MEIQVALVNDLYAKSGPVLSSALSLPRTKKFAALAVKVCEYAWKMEDELRKRMKRSEPDERLILTTLGARFHPSATPVEEICERLVDARQQAAAIGGTLREKIEELANAEETIKELREQLNRSAQATMENATLHADLQACRELAVKISERCEHQSSLLSKKAEKPAKKEDDIPF